MTLTDKSHFRKVMIVAAEASSSLFAQRLLQEWKNRGQQVQAFGVGSQDLEDLGFERIGKSEEMAVVGASEIIEHWGKLKAVFWNLVHEAEKRKPDVVILMDYPEFNLYLARKLAPLNLNIVYYVSPQVWAWRKGRVKTIKRFCRKCFVIFPFEVPFYQQHQVPVQFVGHPILDEIAEKYFDPAQRELERSRRGIRSDEVLLGLMPGSRRIEIREHFQLQLQVARRLVAERPNLRVLVLVAPTVDLAKIQEHLEDVKFPVQVLKEDPFFMIHLCDLVLVTSGTATLQVALMHKPMVAMYRMSTWTYWFAKTFIRGVRHFSLPNLILGREVIPERWQKMANEERLTQDLRDILDRSEYRQDMIRNLQSIEALLGDRGASRRVADALEEYFQESKSP